MRVLRARALRTGRGAGLWRRLERPDLHDWAEYLRRHGGFQAFGRDCAVNPSTYFAGPHLIALGDNVRIAGAWLSTHDGVVNMINRARGLTLDAVGPVVIGSNVFVGYGAIVLPNVRIGDDSVVGAGAVVARDVPPGSVVAGAPARQICSIDELVDKLAARNEGYPWRDLVAARGCISDPGLEAAIARARLAHFFPDPQA